MRVNNQSNGEVDWNQGGSNPQPLSDPQQDQSGKLTPGQETKPFIPNGGRPYTVTFSNEDQSVTSCLFSDPEATVTLNSNWTVSVSTGCDPE
jgi:hypothetical protein